MKSNTFSKYLCFIAFSAILISGCASYKNSNVKKNEQVVLALSPQKTIIDKPVILAQITDVQRGVLDSYIISKGIDYAASGLKSLIALGNKNYTIEYSTGIKNLSSYTENSFENMIDPNSMSFSGFKIIRTVDMAKDKDTALYLSFVVDTTDKQDILNNSIFRLKLDSFQLKYAKAKIPGFKWYMPWTVFWAGKKNKTINMDIEIIFTASWIDDGYKMQKNIEIGHFLLPLRDLSIPYKNDSATYFKLKEKPIDGFSFVVPRSYGYCVNNLGKPQPCWGKGIFNIQVNIVESAKKKFLIKTDKSDLIIDDVKGGIKEKLKE